LSGFFRDNLGINHGVASAMFLMDIADNLYNQHSIGDDLYIAFHLAAEAAMLHDMTNKNKWLHFSTGTCTEFLDCMKQEDVPIATLLCFADNIELGRRSRIKKIIKDKQCTFRMNNAKGRRTKIEYDESKKCLAIKFCDPMSKNCFIFDYEKNCFVLLDIPIN